MRNFRTYQRSVTFYRQSQKLELPRHLRDQLHRAASSVCLNLAEGYGKSSTKEPLRFFETALASLRESKASLPLAELDAGAVGDTADALAASRSIIGHLRSRSPRRGRRAGVALRRGHTRRCARALSPEAGSRRPRAEGRIREPMPDIRRRGVPTS